MPPPRRSLHRVRLLVAAVSIGVQLPALALLSRLTARLGGGWLPYAAAAALTAPWLATTLRRPFADRPRPAWQRRFLLLPFFSWWATSTIYLAGGVLALVAARIARVDATAAQVAALALAALGGLRAVRRTPRLVEVEVPIPGLPPAYDGYRVGQISDVHCGAFTTRARISRWVAQLNAARPDLIAVTGDLVTSGDAFTDDVTAALSGLDAPDGVFACMGNHDYFCDPERLVAGLRDGGIVVLRNEGTRVERAGAVLFVAGVEDNWSGRDDLDRTLAGRVAGETTLLLAHDPNHFHVAQDAGVALQLSGHTHGGQMALPFAGGRYNLARLITRFTHGLYAEGDARLYVSRGAGTTGPPVRLFAPAELTVLTLRTA